MLCCLLNDVGCGLCDILIVQVSECMVLLIMMGMKLWPTAFPESNEPEKGERDAELSPARSMVYGL